MSHDLARSTVAAAWKAVWDASSVADLPVEFQNQPFKRPQNVPWGRYTLLPGETEPAALGAEGLKMERTPFVLIVQVFHPEDTGTRKAYQASDAMRGLNYSRHRQDYPGGFVVVNFNTSGLTPGVAEDGLDAFNVTISGHWDSYQATP